MECLIVCFRNNVISSHSVDEVEKLANFSGVVYSSPEVGNWDKEISRFMHF